MTRRALAVSLVLFPLSVGSAGPQEADTRQEPALTFPAQIEQVIVDVVVKDKKGQPITDLKEEGIEVYEDGVRQIIASFDMFRVPVAPACTWSFAQQRRTTARGSSTCSTRRTGVDIHPPSTETARCSPRTSGGASPRRT